MADHSGDPDQNSAEVPDYPLADGLTLKHPAQYRALFEETRQSIISLLSERAATITELAAALGKPKGTVGHHMKVLADAGLVHVVRTQQVRALVAKYWGRTARIFWFRRTGAAIGGAQRIMESAAVEVGHREAGPEDERGVLDVNRRDVRIPADRAAEFADRLADLLIEFADQPRSGQVTYAMVYAMFRSEHAVLPPTAGRANEHREAR